MARGRVIVRDRNGGPRELRRKLKRMASEIVEVGIMGDPELARIAVHNEFGTRNAPARPFMRTGLDGAAPQIADALARGAGLNLDGVNPRVALARSGIVAAEAVRQSITDFDDPPNAPSTVAKKGFDDPLIHFRKLRGGIDWRISADRAERLREAARERGGR